MPNHAKVVSATSPEQSDWWGVFPDFLQQSDQTPLMILELENIKPCKGLGSKFYIGSLRTMCDNCCPTFTFFKSRLLSHLNRPSLTRCSSTLMRRSISRETLNSSPPTRHVKMSHTSPVLGRCDPWESTSSQTSSEMRPDGSVLTMALVPVQTDLVTWWKAECFIIFCTSCLWVTNFKNWMSSQVHWYC